MKPVITLFLLPACLVLAGSIACADYVQIKYRSGKVQTLRLDEPSSGIVSISYQADNASAPSPAGPAQAGAGKTVDEAVKIPQISTGTSRANDKPPVRIEWAPPVE